MVGQAAEPLINESEAWASVYQGYVKKLCFQGVKAVKRKDHQRQAKAIFIALLAAASRLLAASLQPALLLPHVCCQLCMSLHRAHVCCCTV